MAASLTPAQVQKIAQDMGTYTNQLKGVAGKFLDQMTAAVGLREPPFLAHSYSRTLTNIVPLFISSRKLA